MKDGRHELVDPNTGRTRSLSRRVSGGTDDWVCFKELDSLRWRSALMQFEQRLVGRGRHLSFVTPVFGNFQIQSPARSRCDAKMGKT
jgi:hypothetical protein